MPLLMLPLVNGTRQLLMLVLLGGMLHLLVVVGGSFVVAIVCLEGVRLPMMTMSMLLGRSRANRALCPCPEGSVTLVPHVACGLLTAIGALTSPETLTCS
jgi:hypothetical protein